MAYFYHCTLKKASASVASCKCTFTSPNENNLIIARQSAIEIYALPAVNDTELHLIDELSVYGKILTICPIRLQKENIDALAVLLRRGKVVVYRFAQGNSKEASQSNWRVIASGNFQNVELLRPNEHLHGMCFDSVRNILTVSMYEGIFNIADITDVVRFSRRDNGVKLVFETFRVEDVHILGLTFLEESGNGKSCLAALSLDRSSDIEQSRMRIYKVELPLDATQILERIIEDENADRLYNNKFDLLIPVAQPLGGFLLAGRDSICYRHGATVANACINFEVSTMQAWGVVDPYRYLIGDQDGNLIMVQLVKSTTGTASPHVSISGISVECLGSTSHASSITYLDKGLVYVGSEMGDCQVIQLTSTDQKGNHFRDRIWLENHGPILDMAVLNREVFSQATMITLSGANQDSSLRIIQNGVGIQERLEVLGDQWKSVWAVRLEQDVYEDTFIINEVGSTLAGRMVAEDEMQPIQVDGLCVGVETRYCAMVQDATLLLQATMEGLYFVASPRIAPSRGRLMFHWQPPNGGEISHCSSHGCQILVASVSTLYYLRVNIQHKDSHSNEEVPLSVTVQVISESRLEADVACLDMTPFDTNVSASAESSQSGPQQTPRASLESKLAVVCLWNRNEVLLLTLPDLKLVSRQSLGVSWLARSVAVAELMPSLVYLLVALSNGQLLYCAMDVHTGDLGEMRSITVGDGPMKLTQWIGSNGRNNVFVSSKYPCIVYAHNSRFTITPVNTQATTHMCAYRGQHFLTDCLALLRDNNIYLVEVDDIKNLHTRKIPLYESGHRLRVCESAGLFVVSTWRHEHTSPSANTPSFGNKRQRTHHTPISSSVGEEEDSIVYRPVCPEAVSLNPNVPIHTFALKCPGETSSAKKDFLTTRQPSSLLVYGLRDLNLLQVHSLTCSPYHYEKSSSMIVCSAGDLDGLLEFALARCGKMAASTANIDVNMNANLTANVTSGGGEPMEVEGSVETNTNNTNMTLLIVGTTVHGTESPPHGNSYFGRIHILLWCPTDKVPHFEPIYVKSISGTPYCMALQHGCLLVGVNSSLRCFRFEEEELKEVCDMYQDITIAEAIEVKDNYILLADLMRSIVLLSRKKEDVKFRVIAAHKRPRWTTSILLLDAENFLTTDVDLNMLCATRYSPRTLPSNGKSAEVERTNQGPEGGHTTTTNETAPHHPRHLAGKSRASPILLAEGAMFHLSESVNGLVRGSMRTGTMDDIRYFSDSILYGAISGQIGYLLRIPDEEMFQFLSEVEERILRLFPSPMSAENVGGGVGSTSSHVPTVETEHRLNVTDYREWRQYNAHRVKERARDVVDGNIVERFLDLSHEQKVHIVAALKYPKFLREAAGDGLATSGERDITVEEMNALVEQLSRNH